MGVGAGNDQTEFLFAAVLGLLAFLLVEVLGDVLDKGQTNAAVASGGLEAFLYLEVLDASFSFDGVIGAFALTSNMFLIAIGLGIGALKDYHARRQGHSIATSLPRAWRILLRSRTGSDHADAIGY